MREITIITPLRSGLLADIARVLGDAGINIESIDALDVNEWDVIQLIVDRYDEALQLLRDAGYNAITEDAIVVRLRDEPGALALVTKRLQEADVSIRSVRILQRQSGCALVAISLEQRERGMEVLADLMVKNL